MDETLLTLVSFWTLISDEEKKKYFKIESSRSAPAQAAWSASSVKRRLVETEEEELKRENLARNSGRVKRATLVWDEPLMGGCFLGREARGGAPGGKLEDMRGEAWTMGLRDKGTLRMWPNVAEDRGSVTAMYIGGEEMGAEGGMGMAYACKYLLSCPLTAWYLWMRVADLVMVDP